jgi:hypothetical protein
MDPSPIKKRADLLKFTDSTDSAGFSFDGTDFKGRLVYLPAGRWNWKIIVPHPDLIGYENELISTALDPDLVCFEEGLDDIEIHASFDIGKPKKYLWVPIKYMNDKGLVVTAHWIPRIKEKVTKIIWRRK